MGTWYTSSNSLVSHMQMIATHTGPLMAPLLLSIQECEL